MQEERYHLPETQTLWELWCLPLLYSFGPTAILRCPAWQCCRGLAWFCQPGAHLGGHVLDVVLGPRPWSYTFLGLSLAPGYSQAGLSPLGCACSKGVPQIRDWGANLFSVPSPLCQNHSASQNPEHKNNRGKSDQNQHYILIKLDIF